MRSEIQLSNLNDEANKALNRGDVDALYIIRTQMNEILEKEERKPLDFHSDAYYIIAYLVCLDLYDLPRALQYAQKVKNPSEQVLRRINIINADLDYIRKMSKATAYYLTIARNGSEEQLQENAIITINLSNSMVPNSYGGNFIKIQLLKADAILHYRLGANHYAISVFEKARRLNPSDTEILYYFIKALRKDGNILKANQLVEYAKHLYLKEDMRNLLVNL